MQLHLNQIIRSSIFAAALVVGSVAHAQVIFRIDTAPDLFVPTFRDLTNADLGSTTFYGWAEGTFDGGAPNELMENPAPTLGLGGLNGTLDQLGTADILSGSNNIFIGVVRSETLTMQIPTTGIPGLDGFTTIIIQGRSLKQGDGTGFLTSLPQFGQINGISPTFVSGINAGDGTDKAGQWWAKYELPGNSALYNLSIGVANAGSQSTPLSIAQLTVDTVYSPTGYATDTALVPEPATFGALALGGFVMLGRRRRK